MECATKQLQERYRSRLLHPKLQEIMLVLETALNWRKRETLIAAIDEDWRWVDVDTTRWGPSLSRKLHTVLLTFRSLDISFVIEDLGNKFLRLEYRGE